MNFEIQQKWWYSMIQWILKEHQNFKNFTKNVCKEYFLVNKITNLEKDSSTQELSNAKWNLLLEKKTKYNSFQIYFNTINVKLIKY